MTEKRILVVDDDDAIRALLLTVLRKRGFRIDTARNGVEALERLSSCRYTVVLLDLMMPRMNGYEVLAALEREPETSRPIVLVLTAGLEPRTLSPNLVAGTVRKPFDIGLLVDTIASCMALRDPQEQGDDCAAADSDHDGLPGGTN